MAEVERLTVQQSTFRGAARARGAVKQGIRKETRGQEG